MSRGMARLLANFIVILPVPPSVFLYQSYTSAWAISALVRSWYFWNKVPTPMLGSLNVTQYGTRSAYLVITILA